MAYHVYVFARTGDPVVQRLLPELLHAVDRVPGARATNLHEGVATAGCDLISTGYEGQVVLNVRTQPAIVGSMIEWGRRFFEGAEDLTADTLLELVLIGDMDWRVVRAICEVAVERWSGVICDEGSDHVSSLADLP
jgi:hypothetical protein